MRFHARGAPDRGTTRLRGLCGLDAVGTPPDEDGPADLQHVLAAAKTIGRSRDETSTIRSAWPMEYHSVGRGAVRGD